MVEGHREISWNGGEQRDEEEQHGRDSNRRGLRCCASANDDNSIHNLGLVGHIEDIVVRKDQQGKKLGLRIIEALDHVAKEVGCYKVRCLNKRKSHSIGLG